MPRGYSTRGALDRLVDSSEDIYWRLMYTDWPLRWRKRQLRSLSRDDEGYEVELVAG